MKVYKLLVLDWNIVFVFISEILLVSVVGPKKIGISLISLVIVQINQML